MGKMKANGISMVEFSIAKGKKMSITSICPLPLLAMA
jgi:hypothetical protein